MWKTEFDDELKLLRQVNEQGSDYSSDWSRGVRLIHDNVFTEYVREMIEEEYDTSKWPYRHIDYDSASEEMKSDYTVIEADGETYYIR